MSKFVKFLGTPADAIEQMMTSLGEDHDLTISLWGALEHPMRSADVLSRCLRFSLMNAAELQALPAWLISAPARLLLVLSTVLIITPAVFIGMLLPMVLLSTSYLSTRLLNCLPQDADAQTQSFRPGQHAHPAMMLNEPYGWSLMIRSWLTVGRMLKGSTQATPVQRSWAQKMWACFTGIPHFLLRLCGSLILAIPFALFNTALCLIMFVMTLVYAMVLLPIASIAVLLVHRLVQWVGCLPFYVFHMGCALRYGGAYAFFPSLCVGVIAAGLSLMLFGLSPLLLSIAGGVGFFATLLGFHPKGFVDMFTSQTLAKQHDGPSAKNTMQWHINPTRRSWIIFPLFCMLLATGAGLGATFFWLGTPLLVGFALPTITIASMTIPLVAIQITMVVSIALLVFAIPMVLLPSLTQNTPQKAYAKFAKHDKPGLQITVNSGGTLTEATLLRETPNLNYNQNGQNRDIAPDEFAYKGHTTTTTRGTTTRRNSFITVQIAKEEQTLYRKEGQTAFTHNTPEESFLSVL